MKNISNSFEILSNRTKAVMSVKDRSIAFYLRQIETIARHRLNAQSNEFTFFFNVSDDNEVKITASCYSNYQSEYKIKDGISMIKKELSLLDNICCLQCGIGQYLNYVVLDGKINPRGKLKGSSTTSASTNLLLQK